MNCTRIFTAVIFSLLFVSSALAQNATRTVDGKTFIVHKVSSGETLYKLSKKYNVTVQAIKDANGGKEQINIGQEVLIPSGETQQTGEVAEVKKTVSAATAVTHVVKSGETLSKIAIKYGTTVDELKKLNGMSNADIQIGQKIKVPGTGAAIPTETAENTEVEETKVKVVQEDAVKKEQEAKSVVKPANPRNSVARDNKEDTNVGINKGPRGGIPETADVVLAETATEKEETATVRIIESGMDQTRTFVSHPTLPKGSIIVVINESTGKMAYCRVVDNPKSSDINGATMGMTRAVADKIGMKDSFGSVKIKYAVP